jgi:stringent starvation protein B
MTTPAPTDNAGSSTRPYLIRALHDWCTDNGFTPYIAVHVDGAVRVPMEYVKENEIVLNVGFEATSGLKLGNEWIEFKARFSGGPREIFVPVDHVIAIYARENGQGMAFPMPADAGTGGGVNAAVVDDSQDETPTPRRTGPSSIQGAAAQRGLRLASSDTAGSAADDGAGQRPAIGPAGVPDADEPPVEPPPAPPVPGTGRPSLKRVK